MTTTRSHWASPLGFLLLSVAAAGCSNDTDDRTSKPEGPKRGAWAFYGHDFANTRTNPDERAVSRNTVATLERKWTWDTAPVTSTPAVVDGVVYVGSWRSTVEALDARDGHAVWSSSLQEHNGVNQVNHTPFVTKDTVYAGAHMAELYALKRDSGERIWDAPLVLDDAPGLMLWSSPILVEDLLIIGVGSYQVFIPASPVFRGSVVGVDVNTGMIRWKQYMTDVSGVSVWSSAAIDEKRGLLFIGTGQPYDKEPQSPMSDALVALEYRTGDVAWHRQFTEADVFQLGGQLGPDHDVGASPNLFSIEGRDVVGVGDKGGSYYVLDRETGEQVWRKEMTPGGPNGGVMASTAFDADTIYVASNDARSGGTAGGGSGPRAGRLFALNALDGMSRWEVPMEPGTFGALAVANGVLFVPTLDGTLHALDSSSGEELWSDKVGTTIAGGVTIVDGMVYVGHGWAWVPAPDLAGGLVAYGLPE